MKTTRLLLWMLFLSGALIYVIGFWRACPLLSGKGYFLGVLMTGMFVTYVYQRAVKRRTLRLCMSNGHTHHGRIAAGGRLERPVIAPRKRAVSGGIHHMFTGASFVATSAKYGGLTHQPARIDALQQYGQQ